MLQSGLQAARALSDIARDLSRSAPALSAVSSSSLSNSGSLQSLAVSSYTDDSEQQAARMEMCAALQARRDALEAKLAERTAELRMLCMKEAELTGQLPAELPLEPGEPVPQIRRRMGTAFTLPETLINRLRGSQVSRRRAERRRLSGGCCDWWQAVQSGRAISVRGLNCELERCCFVYDRYFGRSSRSNIFLHKASKRFRDFATTKRENLEAD